MYERKPVEAIPKLVLMLRDERIRQNMSQWQLAQRTGYHDKEISRWEKGVNQPRLLAVIDIANALGKDLVLTDRE